MTARTKITFYDDNDNKFFGEGPARLLHAIEEYGSLRTAALSMDMAYTKALKILKNAEVVVEDEVDVAKINVGCTVKVFDEEFEEEMEFMIVGSSEANSLKGKISNESPVGKALIGHGVGDEVSVETQAGIISYKVLEIQRSV